MYDKDSDKVSFCDVCLNLNCAHNEQLLLIPASGASWRLVSQMRGELEVLTASKPEEVGWNCTSSNLPWPGRRVNSGLLGCSCSGSHKRHSFTCTHREGNKENNIKPLVVESLTPWQFNLNIKCSVSNQQNISPSTLKETVLTPQWIPKVLNITSAVSWFVVVGLNFWLMLIYKRRWTENVW